MRRGLGSEIQCDLRARRLNGRNPKHKAQFVILELCGDFMFRRDRLNFE